MTLWTPGGEHPVGADRPSSGQPPPEPPPSSPPPRGRRPPAEEELSPEQQAQLEEEMSAMQAELVRTPVATVIANHAVGLFQLAALHLNQRPPHLEEGRLAIDAMAALVEGLDGRLGDEGASLREALTQLRMAYVQLQGGTRGEQEPG